jgi:anti-anti-sigma regulatory factor
VPVRGCEDLEHAMSTISDEADHETGVEGAPAAAGFHVTGPVGAAVTLTARGLLSPDAVARFATAARTATRRASTGTDCVIVDLTQVTHLALEALAPLIGLARECQDAGLRLRVRASSTVRAKLQTTGLAELLPQD